MENNESPTQGTGNSKFAVAVKAVAGLAFVGAAGVGVIRKIRSRKSNKSE